MVIVNVSLRSWDSGRLDIESGGKLKLVNDKNERIP